MYSSKKNFLFIHIPKTAGNSIQNILKEYSEEQIVINNSFQDGFERFELRHPNYSITKHSTLLDYQRVLPKKEFSNLFKFAAIRNPWERAISYYFSPHRGKVSWNKIEFIKFLDQIHPITHFVNEESWKFLNFRKVKMGIDHFIRYEHLDEDFRFVCQKLDIPFESLKVRNRSTRNHYSFYYDDQLINLVSERFKEDIILGNYKFNK